MKLLPIKSRSQIFVPMIQMLDNLLVMGVIQSEADIQRLLSLLDPERLAPSSFTSTCNYSLWYISSVPPFSLPLPNLLT